MKGRTRKESPAKDKRRSKRYERMDMAVLDESPPWEDNPLKQCDFMLNQTEAFLSINATDWGAVGHALVLLRQDIYAAVASDEMGPTFDDDFRKVKPADAWPNYLKMYVKGLSDFTEIIKRGQAAFDNHSDYLVRLSWRLWQCFNKMSDPPDDRQLLKLIETYQKTHPFNTVTIRCASCSCWLGPVVIRGDEDELTLKARIERYYDWIVYGETGTYCSGCVEKNLHIRAA